MLTKPDKKLVPLDKLPRASRELADDTLRVMAVTFSYDEDAVAAMEKFISGHGNPAYAPVVYSRLGDLYVEKERFQDAAAVYRAFATREPNSEFSPGLSMQAIEAYRKGGFTQLVLEGKREYVALYNYGTTFWQGRNRADYPNIAKELKINLKDVATYFHANAQKSKKADEYLEAARWYRTYLDSFPDDPESFGTNYLLAETLYEAGDYSNAAAEFTRTAYNYPRNPRSAAAAYAALGSLTKHEDKLPAADKADWHKQTVDLGIKFGTTFPEHPDSSGVLTRAAEDIFATKDMQRSIEVANLVLAHQPPADVPKRRIAYTIIGQANFDLLQFAEAEKGFIAARDLLPPNDKMRADLTERIASSVYRQAEAKQKSGDNLGAVDDFLRIAAVAGTSKIAAQAEYDAGAQLIILKEWPRAIQVLERFRTSNPKSEYTADVTKKLAVAYGETGPGGTGGGRVRAHRAQSGRVEGHPARGQPAGRGTVREGRQRDEGSRHARALRRHVPDAGGRFDRGTPEARGSSRAPPGSSTNSVTGSARSSALIATRAPPARIARSTSPRNRSSRSPRRRATSSARSHSCCRSRPRWPRSARRCKPRSTATRPPLTTASRKSRRWRPSRSPRSIASWARTS